MKVTDVHGIHILDFEEHHLKEGNIEKSSSLSCSPLEGAILAETFFKSFPGSKMTIFPSPKPIFERSYFQTFPFQYENNQLLQTTKYASSLNLQGELIPFFGIYPKEENKEYLDYLSQLIEVFPFTGFKFHPLRCQTPINKLMGSSLMDLLDANGKSLVIHTDGKSHSDPSQIISLAQTYRQVRFCAAHFAFFKGEFLRRVKDFENIYLDSSILSRLMEIHSLDQNRICEIVEENELEEKICFGTDEKWASHFGTNQIKEVDLIIKGNFPKRLKKNWLIANGNNFLGP